MNKKIIVLYYITAAINYFIAIVHIFDKRTNDIWDVLLSLCLGTTWLCIGLTYSKKKGEKDEKVQKI